ncbi:MAG: lamin tail domain-containing protein, partial [Verrucomicrobiota bacterium]|nr:lamin tail domain-containing protein [Verrucomicrobiota bacterium]
MRSKSLYFIIALILLGRVHGQFKITEFLASNENSITDEDSEKSDWIEITNTTAEAFNIGGWHLTDNKSILNKWTFPSLDVPPQSRLIVFASGKNRSLGDK